VLFALISAAVGAYYALRSAYGWPERVPAGQLRKWKYQRSEEAVADLGNARNLTFATLLFLALAIGITWYGPTDPPAFVNAEWGDQKVCGKLIDSNETELSIKRDEDITRQIPLAELKTLNVVEKLRMICNQTSKRTDNSASEPTTSSSSTAVCLDQCHRKPWTHGHLRLF
jgi:hypothetical protein